MATLTLTLMRSMVRDLLNESSTTSITDTEINTAVNDGYKDVAVKALCYESKIAKSNIPAAINRVSLVGSNVVRVNYVEYDLSTSCLGMLGTMPQTMGHSSIDTYAPQYWFQWGEYLVIDPTPDAATYDLNVFASCYPSAVLSNDSDTLSCLPVEFHEDVINFATSFLAYKLRRWTEASYFYNKYIASIQRKRVEYIAKVPENFYATQIPNIIRYEAANGNR